MSPMLKRNWWNSLALFLMVNLNHTLGLTLSTPGLKLILLSLLPLKYTLSSDMLTRLKRGVYFKGKKMQTRNIWACHLRLGLLRIKSDNIKQMTMLKLGLSSAIRGIIFVGSCNLL